MTVQEKLHAKRNRIVEVARAHGAVNIRIFGSMADGRGTEKSDIDLLVDLRPGTSLLDLVAARQEIEKLTDCKVDLVTSGSLSPHIRDNVLRQAVPL